MAAIPTKAAGPVYYISNSTPYGQRLEEGHSTQAPLGMVALTKIQFQQYIRDNAKEVNK